tara:strand:- start:153 stop:434 length:282 start_codon:yes stop_codon:yes gene_type:complete
MNYGYINTVTKYFYEVITKIKIKKSKQDNKKLKELKLALSKAQVEKEIAYDKYSKLLDKTIRISDSITKIESKYSYTKRVKVLNPNYAENQQY